MNNTVPVLQMITQSDIVTMIILGILAFMSLGSWGIIIVKFFKHKSNLRANAKFFKEFICINIDGEDTAQDSRPACCKWTPCPPNMKSIRRGR